MFQLDQHGTNDGVDIVLYYSRSLLLDYSFSFSVLEL